MQEIISIHTQKKGGKRDPKLFDKLRRAAKAGKTVKGTEEKIQEGELDDDLTTDTFKMLQLRPIGEV